MDYFKVSLAGFFPAAVISTFAAVAASHYGLPKMKGTLPLHWPKIGALGSLIILSFFGLLVLLLNVAIVTFFKIDPSSVSGLTEKAFNGLASDPVLFVFALLGAALGAPLIEEVLFRGILFAGLLPRLGRTATVIITSALWASAHLFTEPLIVAVLIFSMGIVLSVLLLRFGSLWVPIACHTAWNLVSTISLYQAGSGS